MKFAIIGTGMMGCEHILNLAHNCDADLIGVVDPNPRSLEWAIKACGERFSPEVCHSASEIIDLRPDAIIIASPNYTHRQLVDDFATLPIHLLIEKPMSTTLEDARAVVAIAETRTALTWIAKEYRYMPTTRLFLDNLHQVGDLKMLFIREHRFPFLKKVDNWNRYNRFTGGTLVEKCCHFFDLMNLAVGARPLQVMASGAQDVNHRDERYEGEQPDIIDNAYVIVDYSNGVRACLDLCMFAEGSPNEQELVATGSLAKLEAHIPQNRLTLASRQDRVVTDIPVPADPRIRYEGMHHGSSYLEQLHFVEAITSGSEPEVSSRDGYWSVAIGLAAQQAIARGQVVAVESL